jgi:anaerobic magnesium-protoporphyrin IX monomethyl ester cyclase
LSPKFRIVLDIANICKEKHPDTPLMVGGHSASFNHDKILSKYECFDFVVRGEGEETSSELVVELQKRKPEFARVRGLSYRENGHVRVNEERPLISDLDSLPFPAFELVSHYRFGDIGGARANSRDVGGILTTRGCHYRCKYCSCSAFSNYTVRSRSPQNVVEELLHSTENHGFNEYIFVDDNFTFNKERVIQICRLIREYDLDIEWHCEGRVNHSNEDMFREMARAGCSTIWFGIESGVDRILRYYRKGFAFEVAQKAVDRARRAGLTNIVSSFIIGAPIETVDEMWTTVRRAAELDIDYAIFNPLFIYKGTPLWQELTEQGLIDPKDWWEDGMIPGFEIHPEITMDDFPMLLQDIKRFFYHRRSYMVKQFFRSLLYRKKKLVLNLLHPRRLIALWRSLP